MKAIIRRKAFGDRIVLSDLEISAEKGESIAILGSSGSGKTTLMRILAGLDKAFDGEIIDPFRKPLVVFQENRLVPSIPVMSNLLAVTRDRDAILSGLEALGLKGEERKLASELSGGMQRRVVLLRALLVPFDALFLDEPFTGLDEETIGRTSEYLLSRLEGRNLFLITHRGKDLEQLGIGRVIAL